MNRKMRGPAKATISPHVVIRTFPLETILLDVQTGTYYGLNRDQGLLLEYVLEYGTVSLASHALAEAGWGTVQGVAAELTALCGELEALALLRRAAA